MTATDFETRDLLTPLNPRPLTLKQQIHRFLELPLIPMVGLIAVFMTSLLNLADLETKNETVGFSGQAYKLALRFLRRRIVNVLKVSCLCKGKASIAICSF